MSEVIVGLNVIVFFAAVVAWLGDDATAEEQERAEFRSLSVSVSG